MGINRKRVVPLVEAQGVAEEGVQGVKGSVAVVLGLALTCTRQASLISVLMNLEILPKSCSA
jgi:hypothetical protein